MARAGAACHSRQTHPGTPQGGRHSQSSSKGVPRWLWARGWGPVAGRGAPLSPCRRRNELPLRGPLSQPVVTRCPRCLHLPAQAGGRGHVLSLAEVSFLPSQEPEATPPSSEPRPPHCLQAAEQAPTPMQQSQPHPRAPGLAGCRQRRQHTSTLHPRTPRGFGLSLSLSHNGAGGDTGAAAALTPEGTTEINMGWGWRGLGPGHGGQSPSPPLSPRRRYSCAPRWMDIYLLWRQWIPIGAAGHRGCGLGCRRP